MTLVTVAEAKFGNALGTGLTGGSPISAYIAESGFGTFNLGSGAAGAPPDSPLLNRPKFEPILTNFFGPPLNKITGGDFFGDGLVFVVGDRFRVSGRLSGLNNGYYTIAGFAGEAIVTVESLVDDPNDGGPGVQGVTIEATTGRAQNNILVGGPDINVGANDVANDSLEIQGTFRKPGSGNHGAGIVCRSNHTTTSDAGRGYFKLYVFTGPTPATTSDIIFLKTLAGVQDYKVTVANVPWTSKSEKVFGMLIVGSTASVFMEHIPGGQRTALGNVDLARNQVGSPTDDLNDSSHQKAGILVYNNAIVNQIDNLILKVEIAASEVDAAPSMLVENLLNAIQFTGHTVTAEEEADGKEVWRIADGRRDASDHWAPKTANSSTWVKVDCAVARTADSIFLDRGHNVEGVAVLIETSPDNSAWTGVAGLTIPSASESDGDYDNSRGITTDEGAWCLRFASATARYWRITFGAMGADLLPNIVGMWLGKTWEPGFVKPIIDESTEVIPQQTGQRHGQIHIELTDTDDDATALTAMDLFNLHPMWIVFNANEANRAVLVDRKPGVYGFEKGVASLARAGSIPWAEREPQLL